VRLFYNRYAARKGRFPVSTFRLLSCSVLSLLLFVNCGGKAKRIDLENEEDSTLFMTTPELTDFIVGPGDQISIEVFGHPELDRKVQIEQNGEFYYPLLGDMDVEGLSVKELRSFLAEKISRYYVDPDVNVTVVGIQSQKIFVLGEVRTPGVYPLQYPVSAFEIVLRAGGFNERAKKSSIVLVRETEEGTRAVKLDLEKVYKDGEPDENIYVRGGDIIYVPQSILTNMEDFLQHMAVFMRPLIDTERSVILWPTFVDVLEGESRGGSN